MGQQRTGSEIAKVLASTDSLWVPLLLEELLWVLKLSDLTILSQLWSQDLGSAPSKFLHRLAVAQHTPKGSDRPKPHRSSWSFPRHRHEEIYCWFQVQSRTLMKRANGHGVEWQQLVAWSSWDPPPHLSPLPQLALQQRPEPMCGINTLSPQNRSFPLLPSPTLLPSKQAFLSLFKCLLQRSFIRPLQKN